MSPLKIEGLHVQPGRTFWGEIGVVEPDSAPGPVRGFKDGREVQYSAACERDDRTSTISEVVFDASETQRGIRYRPIATLSAGQSFTIDLQLDHPVDVQKIRFSHER